MEHRIYKRHCDYCGKYYEGRGKFFCGKSCSQKVRIPWNKGKYHSEKTKKQMSKNRKGDKNACWRGGQHKRFDGHYMVHNPNHPFATQIGYVRRSHLVVEKYLGRYLTRQEVVHHINGDPSDDHPKNLYVFPSNSAHQKYEKLKNKSKLKSNLV